MRQVPKNPSYLLIGGGRLAHHLAYYFQSLEVSFLSWNRRQHSLSDLKQLIDQQDVALLCISDDQLADFYDEHQQPDSIFVHFSGTVSHPGLLGFHPLMTFSEHLYSKNDYQSIHFVGSDDEKIFRQVFPFISNSYSKIKQEQKALYHSLCVLSGNGTTLLWDLIEKEVAKLGLPQQALDPYLKQVAKNILQDQPGRWTGPWYRQDKQTILKNQEALKGLPLYNLYNEFEKLSHTSGQSI